MRWRIQPRMANALVAWIAACAPSQSSPAPDATSPSDDLDGDGYIAAQDCDDSDPLVHPAAEEVCDDGQDNDCDERTDAADIDCADPCELAAEQQSYLGCAFYSLDLPVSKSLAGQPGPIDKPFGISISNPSPRKPAVGVVTAPGGVHIPFDVPPLDVVVIAIPSRVLNLEAPGVSDAAYRITSDRPVAVYQFNPLETVRAASTDASLLFADHTLGKVYSVMNYDSATERDGFVAVYATVDDTHVEVIPTTPVEGPTSAVLNAGEVLLLLALEERASLTGTRVVATQPVGVFAGNRSTEVPLGRAHRDHLEQQMFPRVALGRKYVVAKSHDREFCRTFDRVRVLALDEDTVLMVTPVFDDTLPLPRGDWVELLVDEPFIIEASKPVLVGQYLSGSGGSECKNEGDPAFFLQVPVDQYRRDYVFFAPATYTTHYVNVMATSGTTVMLDGQPLEMGDDRIASSEWVAQSHKIGEGVHHITASGPAGLIVYGFGGPQGAGIQNVSYGYPGGLDLNPINAVD